MTEVSLDEKDKQILRILQEDGRITNVELSKMIGLSAPSTLQRMRKLEEAGVIERYNAIINKRALGLSLTVIVMVSLSLHQEQPIETFRDTVLDWPEVIECLHVSGDADFMLKIVVRDMDAYRDLIYEKLSKVKGVGRIQSCFVLSTDKEAITIPV